MIVSDDVSESIFCRLAVSEFKQSVTVFYGSPFSADLDSNEYTMKVLN